MVVESGLESLMLTREGIRFLSREGGVAIVRGQGLSESVSGSREGYFLKGDAEGLEFKLAKGRVPRLVPHVASGIEVEIPRHVRGLKQD